MTDLPTRADVLTGPTYKIKVALADRTERVYLTVNQQDGKPFEIFIRTDRPDLHEWITITALLVSAELRRGRALHEIAEEMLSIHSGGHSLHVLPDGTPCSSLVEHLGRVLARHARGIN